MMHALKHPLYTSELCLLGADNAEELCDQIAALCIFLGRFPDVCLADVAYTCALQARNQQSVLAIVATSVQELSERLEAARAKIAKGAKRIRDKGGTYYFKEPLAKQGKVAFIFPDVTSFYPDMLHDLCLLFETCRSAFDETAEALHIAQRTSALTMADYIFPPAPHYRNTTELYSATTFSESLLAVNAANMAMYRLTQLLKLKPEGIVGFNGGELAALAASGALHHLSREQRLASLRECFEMFRDFCTCDTIPQCLSRSIYDAPAELIAKLLTEHPEHSALTFSHSPRQKTLILTTELDKQVARLLQKKKIKSVELPTDRPFNTPWCEQILPTFEAFNKKWVSNLPKTPIFSCVNGEPLPAALPEVHRLLAEQWAAPVLFDTTIKSMHKHGFRIFIELGARGNLSNAIDDTLKHQTHLAIALNRIHRAGLIQLQHALGILAAQGVTFEISGLFKNRKVQKLDFTHALALTSPQDGEVQLNSQLPCLKLFSPTSEFLITSQAPPSEQTRKAMPIISERHNFAFGADFPMLTNAVVVEEQPGIMVEILKVLHLADYPFLGDYSLGTSQLSYTHPEMKGLTILSMASGLEMMCEAARKLVPRRRVIQVENLRAQRWVGFERDQLSVVLRAERIAWPDGQYTAVRAQLRDDSPNSAFTWPIMEATILLAVSGNTPLPVIQLPALSNVRAINWSSQDIYPNRLFHGKSLQIIRHVDLWSEGGIDFEIEVPYRASAVRSTKIPLFSVWPMLLDGIVAAFPLWRSHEKFSGAVSLPFRARRIIFHATAFTEGARLRGYLRLKSVTPRSHVADIYISDGNGNLLLHFRGWEEICERIPDDIHNFILRPSGSFLTRELPLALLGNPTTPVAASVVTNEAGKVFEVNQELWLKSLANVVLSTTEHEEWLEMQGTTTRRMEWLFGRAAAKEATRRFLQKYHQARWTNADIPIWPDDSGKPHPLGLWRERTNVDLDLSITHTSRLTIAVVASGAHVGVDVETLGRTLSEDFAKGVFTPEELELAARTGDAPTAILRFWCAKEAISKALGTGIRYSPQDLCIVASDPVTNQVQIELLGQWLEHFKTFKGRRIPIHTAIYEGHTLAVSFLPMSLFNFTP